MLGQHREISSRRRDPPNATAAGPQPKHRQELRMRSHDPATQHQSPTPPKCQRPARRGLQQELSPRTDAKMTEHWALMLPKQHCLKGQSGQPPGARSNAPDDSKVVPERQQCAPAMPVWHPVAAATKCEQLPVFCGEPAHAPHPLCKDRTCRAIQPASFSGQANGSTRPCRSRRCTRTWPAS